VKVLIFSDIHGDLRALERTLSQPADIYIAAGDLSTFGKGLDRCGELLASFRERAWILPGNHESHAQTKALCLQTGAFDFHRQTRTLGSTRWLGLGYSNPTPFNTPGEYTEEEIAAALKAFDTRSPFYIVVHFPPYGTHLDQVAPGKHAGSRVLRDWVEHTQPQGLFCGHIHECAGYSDTIGTTRCFNVGKAGRAIDV
jgi:uncharacterized protein